MNSRDGLSKTIGDLLHDHDSIYEACSALTGGSRQFHGHAERLRGIEGYVKGSGYSCHEFLWFLTREGHKMTKDYPSLRRIYGEGRTKNNLHLLTRLNAWVNNNDLLLAFTQFKSTQMQWVRVSHDSINTTTDLHLASVPEKHRRLILDTGYQDYRMHGLNIYLYYAKLIDPET